MDPETSATNPVKPAVKGYAKNRVANSLGLPIEKENPTHATMLEDNTTNAEQETSQLQQDDQLGEYSFDGSAFSKSSLLDFHMADQKMENGDSVGLNSPKASEELGEKHSPKPDSLESSITAGSGNEDGNLPKQSINDEDDSDLEETSVTRKPIRNNRILDDDDDGDESLFVETPALTRPAKKKPAISNISPDGVVNNAIFGSRAARENNSSPPQRKKPVISNISPEDVVNDALYGAGTSRKKKQSNKVSKKELEETEKETKRLERGLELAPDVKNNKTFTISGFLDKFEKPSKNPEPSSDMSNSPKSPEENKELTPATSPMEMDKDGDADLFEDPFASPKKTTVQPAAPSSSPIMSEQKEEEEEEDQKKNKKPLKFTPRKLIRFFDKKSMAKKDEDGSDSDLEIELSPKVMKARALDKLDKIKPSDNSSHYKYQRMFKQKLNQPKSLMAVVEAKHREQVMRDREEKMAAIKAKGGTVMTEEEKNKENDIIESLLEREQRKADELRKQEQDDAEEEEDEDYDPEKGEREGEEDNALEILDDEELEEFEEPRHVEEEAEEDAEDENKEEDDVEVMDEKEDGNGNADEDEDQSPNLQRRKAKIVLDSDDEEIDAAPAESKPTEVDSTQVGDSMSQLFEPTQALSGQSGLSPKSKLQALREQDEPISFTDGDSAGEHELQYDEPANTQEEINALKLRYRREREAAAPEPTQLSQISAPSSSDVENEETQVDTQQIVEPVKKKKKKSSYDRSKSAAKEIVDEEAMESDDEWAGLGGKSDDDDDDNEEFLKELVDDNSKEASNEAAVRKLFAENERVADNKLVNQLMEDVTYGGWRKRKGNNGDSLGLSDDEFDEAYYREERRRREERKRQKLMEDESISSLANNPKAQAFLNSIADHTVSIGKSIVGDEEQGDQMEKEEDSQQSSKKKWSITTIREQLSFLDEDEDGDEVISQNIRKIPSKFTIEDEDEQGEKEPEDEESDSDDEIQAIQTRRRSEHTVDRMSEKQSFFKSKNSQTNVDDEDQPVQISSIKRVANVKTEKIIKDVEVLRSLSMPARKNPRPAPSHALPQNLQATKAKTTSIKKKKIAKPGISAKMFVKGEWDA